MVKFLAIFLVFGGCLASIQGIDNESPPTMGQLLDAINHNLSICNEIYNELENQAYEITERGLSNILNKLTIILEDVVNGFPVTEALEAEAKLEEEAKELGADITTCTRSFNFSTERLYEIVETINDLNKFYVLQMDQANGATIKNLNSIKTLIQNYENDTEECLKQLESASIVRGCLLQVLSRVNMAVVLLKSQREIFVSSMIVYMEQTEEILEKNFEEHVQKWPEQVDHVVGLLTDCVEDIFSRNETVKVSLFVQ